LWNTDSRRSRSQAGATGSRASASATVNGLSTTTLRPARSASRASGWCVSLGVAMTTRSRSSRAISSAGVACTATPGQSACTLAASELATAASSSAGTAAISGVWKVLPA